MTKLERCLGLCMLLAAVGCSSSGDTTDRRPGTSPRGTAGSSPFGSGFAGSSGPITPSFGTGGAPGVAPVTPGAGNILDGDTCAGASVRAARVTPTVHLVIDGSSSMNAPFGGNGTRWSVLRTALVGTTGVVTKLESVVNFGMTIYGNSDPMMCPNLREVKPKLDNFMAIDMAYPPMETGGGTPTGEALQRVVDSLPNFNEVGPDSKAEVPPIIVLATDGEPNGCANGVICNWIDWATCLTQLLTSLASAPATYDSTLAAVRAAKAKGIQVWVVSLADGLNAIPDLQRTANIGAGLADNANPGATIYSPRNPDELTNTLTKLIGDVVSCNVELKGALTVDRACEGTVTMNGQPLMCNGESGWKVLDETHIELMGTACTSFKSDPSVSLEARFPCGVVRPI